MEISIVEIKVQVEQERQNDLIGPRIGSEYLLSVTLKVQRNVNLLMRGRECKKGGSIPLTENSSSSSRSSLLNLLLRYTKSLKPAS
ncbi:hypothetical protein TNCV_2837881 [Trichonephila clavipes]|nr:hypothetical protein TNCV_2837881 [Trichonephila clavipes]